MIFLSPILALVKKKKNANKVILCQFTLTPHLNFNINLP